MFTLIRPAAIPLAALTDSNVAETITLYSGGASYDTGETARIDGANGARYYESLVDDNSGNPVTDTTKWIDRGPTNRWKALDGSTTSQTLNAESIEYEFVAAGRADSVAVFNVDAASLRVKQTTPGGTVVFDETISLVSTSGITDWWAWLFEPIERATKKVVFGLKPYVDATITVTLASPGGVAACGLIVAGQSKGLGGTRWGGSFGIDDFSVKGKDEFGNSGVVERAFADRAGFTVWVNDAHLDNTGNLLTRYRATPIVWVGDPTRSSTVVYGWPETWNMEFQEGGENLLSIDLGGLT
jgi:hypothetical protein